MSSPDVQLTGLFTELLPAGHFNRRVKQTRNKAVVLLEMTLSIVQRILTHGAGRSVQIHVDRQGGRQHYAERLMTFFDGCALRILDETDTRSAYQLTHADRTWSIEFITSGETHHLPIALASVYSKYLRELLMDRFNSYFGQLVEGLTPTAGYYTDALRFLADVAPAIRAERIDKTMLIRSR
jgi:hypothetical protein